MCTYKARPAPSRSTDEHRAVYCRPSDISDPCPLGPRTWSVLWAHLRQATRILWAPYAGRLASSGPWYFEQPSSSRPTDMKHPVGHHTSTCTWSGRVPWTRRPEVTRVLSTRRLCRLPRLPDIERPVVKPRTYGAFLAHGYGAACVLPSLVRGAPCVFLAPGHGGTRILSARVYPQFSRLSMGCFSVLVLGVSHVIFLARVPGGTNGLSSLVLEAARILSGFFADMEWPAYPFVL